MQITMTPHQLLRLRHQVIHAIRGYFENQGFLEVDTPLILPTTGTEPYLEVFETKLTTDTGRSARAFLPTSPELSMKKLLAQGSGSIYQITKSFRNQEDLSNWHNHEFTLLEFYRVGADYHRLMQDVENLFLHLVQTITGQHQTLSYQSSPFRLNTPWPRFSIVQLFRRYLCISKDRLTSSKLTSHPKLKNLTSAKPTWDEAFHLLFLNFIDPQLARLKLPVFIYDYPLSQAALAKKCLDPRFAQRFEWYLAGLELGNGFSELTDWREQKRRMLQELKLRRQLGMVHYGLDHQFIQALKTGMPESAGIAIGVDRLIMLLADTADIKDVLTFPIATLFDIS